MAVLKGYFDDSFPAQNAPNKLFGNIHTNRRLVHLFSWTIFCDLRRLLNCWNCSDNTSIIIQSNTAYTCFYTIISCKWLQSLSIDFCFERLFFQWPTDRNDWFLSSSSKIKMVVSTYVCIVLNICKFCHMGRPQMWCWLIPSLKVEWDSINLFLVSVQNSSHASITYLCKS